MSGRRAVFLDRDGVLIRDVVHLTSASQIEILPGVPESLRRLRDAGWLLVVVTNQSVVARGLVTEEQLGEIHRVLEGQLRARGAAVDAIYYCPHHPEGVVTTYRTVCDCRKPEPGMLLRATADLGIDLRASVMVGDAGSDIEAGRRAGCRTVRLRAPSDGGSAADSTVDHVAPDLASAAGWILASRRDLPAVDAADASVQIDPTTTD